MKNIPTVDPQDDFCQQVWNRIYRSMEAPYFLLAAKTGLFEKLVEPAGLDELIADLGYDPAAAEPFLEVIAAMGLIELKDGKYVNHPQTNRYLVSSAVLNHLPSCLGMMEMMSGVLNDLEEILLQGGDRIREELMATRNLEDEQRWARMARSMLGSGLHQAQLLLPHLKDLPEWNSLGRMMDLGGGPGAYCLVFVSNHPTMTGVVFDQPAVTPETSQIISEFGLADRVSVQSGDYINDPDLGEGYDLIWSCATLNFAKGRLTPLFEKLHQALNPGGILASFHPIISGGYDLREKWEMVVGMSPYAMVGLDMQLRDEEPVRAMLAAGFQAVQSKDVRSIHGFQRLDLGRKAS